MSGGIFVHIGECRTTFAHHYLHTVKHIALSLSLCDIAVVVVIVARTFGVLRTFFFFTSKKLRETFQIFICLVCVALLLHQKKKKKK